MKKIITLLLLFITLFSCQSPDENKNSQGIDSKADSLKSFSFSKSFLLGKFDYRDHPDFVLVSENWSDKEIYLQKKAYLAFEQMAEAADKDGIPLIILSGTRNFDEQKVIWERKWEANKIEMQDEENIALKILMSSSMPSSSRHHWGTDIDINSVEESYFQSGQGENVYSWLKNNASKFNFCQVYDDKKITKRTGYELEKWHWSYMPISSKILNEYKKQIKSQDINGFQGSHLASSKNVQIINNYVLGISKNCN